MAGIFLFAVIGFLLGAPAVPAHVPEYLNGIRVLAGQYSGIQLGHSHYSGGPVRDLWLSNICGRCSGGHAARCSCLAW